MQNSLTTKKAKNKAGVTLIELLVVIMIVATVMAISIPAFTSMGRGAGMRGAVSAVTSTLALSRQWAITKREPVIFEYGKHGSDVNTGAYFTVYVITNELQGTNQIMTIQKPTYLTIPIAFGGSNTLTFKTDGGLEGPIAPIPTITIQGQGATNQIRVNVLTGAITVE